MQRLHGTSYSPGFTPRLATQGFTLLEMLVGTAVLCILVVILASTLNQASRVWTSGSGDAERRRGARSLTDFISMELAGAQIPVGGVVTQNTGNLQFLINPPVNQVPDEYRNADCIFWQAPVATEASMGELAALGYFVKWDETNADRPRPLLCRYFINPTIKDVEGEIERNPNFLVYASDPDAWLSEELINKASPASKQHGYVGLFAENVVGFWVRSYGLDGQELPRDFDSRQGYNHTVEYSYKDNNGVERTGSKTETRDLPARVKISLVQIDSSTLPPWFPARLPGIWTTDFRTGCSVQ